MLQLNPKVDEALCSATDTLDQIVAMARKGSYDERQLRMDGWRDVDLGGDHLGGGGPSVLYHWQTIQEIVAR